MTLEKTLDSLTKEDLTQLIENQVIEKKDLEYKLSLPSNRDEEKKEFLADIVSFANSSGGDIIYGMAQDNTTGFPMELTGIGSANIDQEILRIESIIRDGIEPRIPSVITHSIALENSKAMLIIRIQKSWVSPHRIKFKGDHRFYARGTNGKYELDVGELRNAFTLSENINEKIKKFRENRISSIFANETPVAFYNNAKVVLHLVPLISFNPSTAYDIQRIASKVSYYKPMYCSGWGHRYNLDGLLSYSVGSSELSHSYTQFYRNGIVEAVDGLLLKPDGTEKNIPSIAYERELISSLPDYLSGLKYLNVELPIVIFLTLVGVKGYAMTTSSFFEGRSCLIDREILLLPEVLINSYEVNAAEVLRPIFDAVWNSCGFAKSLNYNDSGEWKPRSYYH